MFVKSKILIVEDKSIEAKDLKESLKSFGYNVVGIASTGDEAINMVAELKVDLVIMDVDLKEEMDGIEAAENIWEEFDIPVVYLTSHTKESMFNRVKLTSTYGYLIKPVNKTDLKNNIEIALYKHQMEGSLKHNEALFKSMLDSAPLAILLTIGTEEKVEFINSRFTEIFGYTIEDIPDVAHWWPLAYPDPKYRQKIKQIWTNRVKKAVQNQTEIEPVEAEVTCKDRTIRTVEAKLSSIGEKNLVFFTDITENKKGEEKRRKGEERRKRGEAALKKSEERFRAVAESAVDAIITTDIKGNIKYANKSLKTIFGYSLGELTGKPLPILMPKINRENYLKELKKFNKSGEHRLIGKKVTTIGLKKDGTEFPFEMSLAAWKSENKTYFTSIIRDITERKKAENELKTINKALKKRDIEFRHFIDDAPVAIAMFDRQMRYIAASKRWIGDFNLKGIKLQGRSHYDIFPEITDELKEIHRHALAGSIFHGEDDKFVRADGTIQYIRWEVHPWYLSSDDIGGIIIFSEDITERKTAEEELKSNQWRLEMSMEIANLAYWEYNIEEDIFTFNDKFYSLYSTSAPKEGGYQMSSAEYATRFVPPEEQVLVGEEVAKAIESENPNYSSTIQHSIIRRDGERRFIIVRIRTRLDKNGQKIGTNGVNQDVTELVKAEKALKESEEKYRTLFQSDPDYTILVGMDGVLLDVNRAAEQITGLLKDELIGRHFMELEIFPNEDLSMHKEMFSHLSKGEYIAPYESRIYDKEGKIRWVETLLTIIKKEEEPDSILIINNDITKRKRDDDVIKASLKEKEILLKEIHHRVKNNLQIIYSLLDLQEDYVKENSTAVNVLNESQNRVLAMSLIHETLYQSKDLSLINFSDYIKNLISNLFYSYGSKSNITQIINVEQIYLNIETSVPLGLIITELVSNSLKYAFPEDKSGKISVKLVNKDGEFELTIEDNGIGIPEEISFNTESTLGLRLVNTLVNQLDGTIELNRTNGTQFIITFKELTYNKRV